MIFLINKSLNKNWNLIFYEKIYKQFHKMISNKMNKLVFIYLLSLVILNTQCTSCSQATPPAGQGQQSQQEQQEQQSQEGQQEQQEQQSQEGQQEQQEQQSQEGQKEEETQQVTLERRRLAAPEKCTGADKVTGYDCVFVDNACTLKSLCELETDTSKCETHNELTDKKCTKAESSCQLTSTATNSSNILNIFKITFILLFIFTVL